MQGSHSQRVDAEVAKDVADYRFDNVSDAPYRFTGSEYCNVYLELTKCADHCRRGMLHARTDGALIARSRNDALTPKAEIDVAAGCERLSREMARRRTEVFHRHAKLQNESFVARARPAVVKQEPKRLAEYDTTTGKLKAHWQACRPDAGLIKAP